MKQAADGHARTLDKARDTSADTIEVSPRANRLPEGVRNEPNRDHDGRYGADGGRSKLM